MKANFIMCSVFVHVMTSLVYTSQQRYRLQHTCPVYFSAHCVHEWDERMLVVLAGVVVRPEKFRGES